MKPTPDNIWAVPAYLPYIHAPLTDEAVRDAEQEIGQVLPDEYLELLRQQNGGYIRFALPELDATHRLIAGIGSGYPSLTDFDLDEHAKYVSFPLQGLVPFDGDGHWFLCLDYRENRAAPPVSFIDVECDRQSIVGASFAEYMSMLRIDLEDSVGEAFVAEATPARLATELGEALGVAFEPPDSWAHGYPVRRARSGTQETPEWIWISPNRVPTRFVREGDPRSEDLKGGMKDESDRFPGLPERASILNVTEGLRNRVIESCGQIGVRISPLRDALGL